MFLYQVTEQRGEHSTTQLSQTFLVRWTGAPDRAGNILTNLGLVVTTTVTDDPEPFPTWNISW